MASASGQVNFYTLNLDNRLDGSPIENICIHTSRTDPAGNYITLGIPDALKVKDSLATVSTYVSERLEVLGGQLAKWAMAPWADEVLNGRAVVGDKAPSHVVVSNYAQARSVIDDLFHHHEMSASNRSAIENPLRELEKSAQFSRQTSESISTAQKDIIESLVSPYIDDIKAQAPDSETARQWIKCAANGLSILGPSAKNSLSSLLWTACQSGHGKSDDFYESLFAVAKIYASMGDLEGAFSQSGVTLPSGTIVKQTVLDLFN